MVKKLKQLENVIQQLYKLSEEQLARVGDFIQTAFSEVPAADVPRGTPQLALVPEVQNDGGVPTEEILKLYHELCPKLPKVKTFDSGRRKAVGARWREDKTRQTLAWWRRFFSFVNNKCPFLVGDNDRQWRANFDFLMKKQNMRKVIENGYSKTRPA